MLFGKVVSSTNGPESGSATYVGLSWDAVREKVVVNLYEEDELRKEASSRTYSGE